MASCRRIGLSLEINLLYKHHIDVFAGVQRYADEHGWETVIDDWCEVTLEDRSLPIYDGVIARVHPNNLDLIDIASRQGVPLVNVMRGTPAYDRLPGAYPDFREAARIAAEHLYARGLRSFGLLSLEGDAPCELLSESFVKAADEAGCVCRDLILPASWGDTEDDYRSSLGQITNWMNRLARPVGIAVCNSHFSRMLVKICQEQKWRVPGDAAIVSMMNEDGICEQPRPSISGVELGYDRIGYEAARLLDRLMEEKGQRVVEDIPRKRAERGPSEVVHLTLPPTGMVVRESTDFFAVDDALVAEALAYIAEQCHMPLQVNDIAEYVGVSSKTLQNRFAQALDRSVAQEVRRIRIERVKRELADTNRSVDDIAQRAGFASGTRLYEVFKRELGTTPSAYRKQRRIEAKARGNHAIE